MIKIFLIIIFMINGRVIFPLNNFEEFSIAYSKLGLREKTVLSIYDIGRDVVTVKCYLQSIIIFIKSLNDIKKSNSYAAVRDINGILRQILNLNDSFIEIEPNYLLGLSLVSQCLMDEKNKVCEQMQELLLIILNLDKKLVLEKPCTNYFIKVQETRSSPVELVSRALNKEAQAAQAKTDPLGSVVRFRNKVKATR